MTDGPERQASAFEKSALSVEPVYNNHQQYPSLLKKMCMPVLRGLESNHGFVSFEEDSKYFLKFYLFTPPVVANYPLFPHQDVVSLLDPCSGFVSPAADAEQQPSVGRATESQVDYRDRKPHQCPHHRRESPAWPRETSWKKPARTESGSPGTLECAVYGSAASTSCLMNNVHIFDLLSICCVGAVNFEDSASVDLVPLNRVLTSKPHYTSTVVTPNIPGYTGKVHWLANHPANSNLPSTVPPVIAGMHG
ncbi:LOW QUALITY PROTEIN: protein SPMIP7 [Cyanocitta cristata]